MTCKGKEELISIEGHITAISHSIWLSHEQLIMFMEVDCDGIKEFVLVRHLWQLNVFSLSIKMFNKYLITKLRKWKFMIGEYKIPVLIATKETKLMTHRNGEGTGIYNLPADPFGLTIYKGKITQVIDNDAGIYILDGKIKLVITFLKDITAELCTGKFKVIWPGRQTQKEPNLDNERRKNSEVVLADEEEMENSEAILAVEEEVYARIIGNAEGEVYDRIIGNFEGLEVNMDECLSVGDFVKVYNAHYDTKDGYQRLVCCGRSMVANNRCRLFRKSKHLSRWINQAIDKYAPPLGSLSWLLSLRQTALDSLTPNIISQHQIDMSMDGEEEGLLSTLLYEASKRQLLPIEKRNLAKEFLLLDHSCPVTRTFEAKFHLMTINSLMEGIQQKRVSESLSSNSDDGNNEGKKYQARKPSWNFNISSPTKPHRVLVGKLIKGINGGLQLQQESECIDIILLQGIELCKIGSLVAVFEYSVVDEEFNIMAANDIQNVSKFYLLVSDMCMLRDNKIDSGLVPSSEYRIQVLLKSPLIYKHSNNLNTPEDLRRERFFMIRANIFKLDADGVVIEDWQRFIRFKGKLADLSTVIQDGDIIMLNCANIFRVLKQAHTDPFLLRLSNFFPSLNCVYLPEDTTVNKISSENGHYDELSIGEALEYNECIGLIYAIGIVKIKNFTTPKYLSQSTRFPTDLNISCNIGVPGGKCTSLVLVDEEEQEKEVWLYTRDVSGPFAQEYAKGVVPGTKVLVTACERKIARLSGNVYLHATVYSRIVPLNRVSLCIKEPQIKVQRCGDSRRSSISSSTSRSSNSSKELCMLEPKRKKHGDSILSSSMPFVCFATITRVIKVVMKPICSSCDSNMEDGLCIYVNCKARSTPKISSYAELTINDGTRSVTVITNKQSQIEDILKLSESERVNLYNFVLSNCEALKYVKSRKIRQQELDPEIEYDLESDVSCGNQFLQNICNRSELLRPMKFTLHIMRNFERVFCKEVAELRPCIDNDDAE